MLGLLQLGVETKFEICLKNPTLCLFPIRHSHHISLLTHSTSLFCLWGCSPLATCSLGQHEIAARMSQKLLQRSRRLSYSLLHVSSCCQFLPKHCRRSAVGGRHAEIPPKHVFAKSRPRNGSRSFTNPAGSKFEASE